MRSPTFLHGLTATALAAFVLLAALPAAAQGRPDAPGSQGREIGAARIAAAEKKQEQQRTSQARKKDKKAAVKTKKVTAAKAAPKPKN